MNIENLKIFRDGFKELMDKGIVTQDSFDMENFRSDSCIFRVPYLSNNDCGTVGCLLGWAPFVKGLEPIESDYTTYPREEKPTLNFRIYRDRVFNLDSLESVFLFDSYWKEKDNTPEGALKRLDYLINNPDTFKKGHMGLFKVNYQ